MMNKKALDLDGALEEVAKKVRPTAAVYTVNPSNCNTGNCSPQCDCCSDGTDAICYGCDSSNPICAGLPGYPC